VLKGRIELTAGEVTHELDAGDCLAMRLEGPTAFHNPTSHTARYLVAPTADPLPVERDGGRHRGSAA
jgi:uncharacterized cupin superfamily protein